MTLDPRAVTTDFVPLGGDAIHLPAGGVPWHRSVHIHPKSRAREGLGVRKGHPRPGDSTGPARKVKGTSWPESGASSSISAPPMPSKYGCPGGARDRLAPYPPHSPLITSATSRVPEPSRLMTPEHLEGGAEGGREGPEGQGATRRRERRSCGHTPEV